MNIKENSWHYFIIKLFFKPSKSFCMYFWQVIIAIFLLFFFSLAVYTFSYLFGIHILDIQLGYILIYSMSKPILYPLIGLISIALFTIGAIITVLLIVAIFIGISNIWKNKGPNIFFEYWKAKINRVCPQITFIKKDKTLEENKDD